MGDASRDGMGSKADMISSKFNEVARNEIWREHVHKEDRRPRDQAPFQINPHNLVAMCPKPNQTDPAQISKASAEQTPEMAELAAKLERKRGMGGVTELESEETGYFADRALLAGRFKTNRRWYKGKSSCDITQYADRYTTSFGSNPFADKGSR